MAASIADPQSAYSIILGTGITGAAISRSLSAAGMLHVLVGAAPGGTPRLGESLNAEASLEIVRQFPDLQEYLHDKRRLALFFGDHALRFDSLSFGAGHPYYSLLDYPATVDLLHVDRVGFDQALFASAIAQDQCLYLDDTAVALQYDEAADRIGAVQSAGGKTIAATYVFDATNAAQFLSRRIGVTRRQIGETRRVVFAHYAGPAAAAAGPGLPWMDATSLLRLDSRHDPVEGLAWCIPLGAYISVGISVDPDQTGAVAGLLLDWVERAYSRRGIDFKVAFPERGKPLDFTYEHYTLEPCYGRNWLLAGTSCCQFWFPSASGVATSLVAARLAPDILRAPERAAPIYQDFVDRVAASHAGLEWLVRDDPWQVTAPDLQQRATSMVAGNVKRLGAYVAMSAPPPELDFGNAPLLLFERDRVLASPFEIETAPPSAQGTRLFRS